MLCRRPTKLEESVKEMQGKTFIIEEKLDGERMQLHKRGNEFFYCSRWVSECLGASQVSHRATGKERITPTCTEATGAQAA